jgi:hypothetical protein
MKEFRNRLKTASPGTGRSIWHGIEGEALREYREIV